MAIWNVIDQKSFGINLLKTGESTFRVVQAGELNLLHTGSDYTLVHSKILSAFDTLLSDQLEITQVSIFRKATDETWTDYHALDIKQHLTIENIDATNSDGDQIWQFQHNLFVSDHIKNRLIDLTPTNELLFSEGFSMFGGV